MITKLKNELNRSKTFLSFVSFKFVGEGLVFILPLILANFLSPAGFGSFSLSMMIAFFCSTILLTSSQTPFIVLASEEFNREGSIKKSFTNQLIFFIISIFLFLLLTAVFDESLLEFARITDRQLLFLGVAYSGICIKVTVSNTFLALNKRTEHSIYEFLTGLIAVLLILIVYAWYAIDFESVFAIYFISSVFSTLLMLKKIDFSRILPLTFDIGIFKETFRWTKWQIMGLTAVYFINWGDNLVLRYFVSMEEIGVYNLGYQIFKGLIGVTFILNSYFLPFISQNIDDKGKMKDYLYVKRPKIMLVGTLGIIFIFIVAPSIFDLVYGDAYKESVTVLRILLIGCIIALYQVFYIPLINSLKKYKFAHVTNIIHVVLNILFNIILVQKIGIYGVAVGTVLAYGISLAIYEIYFYRNKLTVFSYNN